MTVKRIKCIGITKLPIFIQKCIRDRLVLGSQLSEFYQVSQNCFSQMQSSVTQSKVLQAAYTVKVNCCIERGTVSLKPNFWVRTEK
ncbi:hypothetical protein ACFX13_002895 [Malus domestica]